MKKTYIAIPLAALVVFSGFYATKRASLAAEKETEAAREHAAREAASNSEKEARRLAVETALKSQRERKALADTAEAAEKVAQEQRRAALDLRDKTRGERDRAARRLKESEQALAVETDAITRLRKTAATAGEEVAHLKDLVARAEANECALTALLNKIPATPAPAATGDRT